MGIAAPTSGLISVVVPMYNAASWVKDALQSVIAQTYPHWELLVIDDGSSDASASLALASLRGVHQPVQLISTDNQGVSKARNLGISGSVGDYVAFLDADDWWYPEKLASQIELLERDPNLIGASCWFEVVNDANDRILFSKSAGWDRTEILRWMTFETGGPLLPSTLLVRRSELVLVGGFDEQLSTAADTDLAWRLVSRGRIATVTRPLARYRISSNQMHRNVSLLRHDYGILYAREPFADSPKLVAQCEANMAMVSGLMEFRRCAVRSAIRLWADGLATHPVASLRGIVRRFRRRLM